MNKPKLKPFTLFLAIISTIMFIVSGCNNRVHAEEYTYQDVAIDWLDSAIDACLPLSVNVVGLDQYVNTMLNTKQELYEPGTFGDGNSISEIGGKFGFYYNSEGELRQVSLPTFNPDEHITGSACICSSPDFTITVSLSGTPSEDSFWMQYFESNTTFGVSIKHSGTSPDWAKHVEVDGGSYFTNSPWTFSTSLNTVNVSVASLRSTATIPTISNSYNVTPNNSGVSLTLFGSVKESVYPTGLSDVALYQLMQPALLNSYLNEIRNGILDLAPNANIPFVPEYNNNPTNNIPNVDIPVFTPILTPIDINGVAVIGAAAGAIVMGGININMPIDGIVDINGTPFEIPFDDLGIDGHTIDFPDSTHFTFDDMPITINPDGSLTIDGTTYQYPIGQYETIPSENNNFAYQVEMPTLETIEVDNMQFNQPDLSGVSDGVSWWWSVTHTILDDSGILSILPILFGLGLLGFSLYKLGG